MDDFNILNEDNQHTETNHFNIFLNIYNIQKNWNQGVHGFEIFAAVLRNGPYSAGSTEQHH